MKTHKQIFLYLFLTIVVTGCANVATNTPLPVSTATSIPSPTLIPPTATVEPSPTVDPNMPLGATGKDAQGDYIKPLRDTNGNPVIAENGQSVYETWLTFSSGLNGETMTGWFVNHVINPTLNGGIPAEDMPSIKFSPAISIHILAKETIDFPYVKHVTDNSVSTAPTFTRGVSTLLMENYFQKSIVDIINNHPDDYRNFRANFPGNISIPIIDAQGNPRSINGNEMFQIIIVNSKDLVNPEFKADNIISNTIFDEKNNTITILVASTTPFGLMKEQDILDLITYPFLHLLAFKDQSQAAYSGDPGKSMEMSGYTALAGKGEFPHFKLQSAP